LHIRLFAVHSVLFGARLVSISVNLIFARCMSYKFVRSGRRRAAVTPALLLLLTPFLPPPPLLAAPPTKSRPEATQRGPCPRRSRGGGSSRPQTGQRSGSSPSPPRWRGGPACTPVSRPGRALGWRLCRVAPSCRRRPALPRALRGARGRYLRRRHRSRRPPAPR